MSLEENPYDSHTLGSQFEQVRSIVGADMAQKVFEDRRYRGHKHQGPENVAVDRERRGKIPSSSWRLVKRRAATEPIIGRMKNEHRLERNRLKATVGNAINGLSRAAAMNFGKLLGWVGRFGLVFLALPAAVFLRG